MNFIRKYDYEKLIFTCWLVLFILWVYVALSGNYFEIIITNPTLIKICDFIDGTWILNKLARFIMYYFNWIFVIHAIFKEKLFKYKPIRITIMIFFFWLIKNSFEHIPIVNYIDFVYFGIIAILCRSKWYRAVIGCGLVFLFGLVSSFIKGIFIPNVDFDTFPILIAMCLYIDVYLMSAIYYLTIMYRKENNYGKLFHLFQITKEVESYFSNIGNSIANFFRRNRSVASIKSNAYNLYCGIIFTGITYLSLLIIGIIFNRWIEITVSAICFHIFRGTDTKTYHAKNDIRCWYVSMLSFSIIMKLTLPIYISYIVSIALPFVLCMIMRLTYYLMNVINIANKKRDKKKLVIDIVGEHNINEEYIKNLCLSMGLAIKYANTVYLYLTIGAKEAAINLDVDDKTITRRINTFIEKGSKN